VIAMFSSWKKAIFYTLLVIGAFVMLMPFAWMILTSVKLDTEVESWPPKWTSNSFAKQRNVKLNLVRSADVALDFSSLSIEEFFNLASIIGSKKKGEKTLVYSVNDDTPYRGIFELNLNAGAGKNPTYARAIPRAEFDKFLTEQGALRPLPDEVQSILDTVGMVDDPIVYLPSLMNELFFSSHAFLNRIGVVTSSDGVLNKVNAYLVSNGVKLVEHRALLPSEQDEPQTALLKAAYRDWLERLVRTFETQKGIYTVANQFFRKGQPLLSQADLEEISAKYAQTFADGLTYTGLAAALNVSAEEAEALVSEQDWAVIRLVDRNIREPLKSFQNLLRLGITTYRFYTRLQTDQLSSGTLRFQFRKEADIKQDILEQIKNSSLTQEHKRLTQEVLEGHPVDTSVNALLKELDRIFTSHLSERGIDPSKIQSTLLNLKDFVGTLNSVFLDHPELKEPIMRAFLGDGDPVDVLNASSVPASQRRSLVDQLNRLKTLFRGQPDALLYVLIHERFVENEVVEYYSEVYSRYGYRMDVLEAPKEVKDVRFRSYKSIEIVLDGIQPYWFWDETQQLQVSFTFKEIFQNVFQSYVDAWVMGKYFGNYYFNTVFVALVTTLLDVLFACMAAFAFSKLNFFGKNFIFMVFLATMMVPGEVLLVPNYITLARFGWMDTYLALIVPWVVSVFVIFLMRQHFMTIPDELYDAGKIDGISKWGFLWKVMAPLSKPVIITGALLKFVGSWNSFLWVLIVTKSPQVRTLPVGLSTFSTEVGTLYNKLMAASTFSMIPVIILFLFVQKYFIQGIARTGLKG